MDFNFDIIEAYLPYFGEGVIITLTITAVSVFAGSFLGLLLSLLSLTANKFLKAFYLVFITLFRGTPLLVQLFIFHFAILPAVLPVSNPIYSAMITLALNASAYIAEIFRGAIDSIDKGQDEAARSLGLSKVQSLRYVILPQAFKRSVPALGNEAIVLLKDSSLAVVIAAKDILFYARAAAAEYLRIWEPYLFVALIYLCLTIPLTIIVNRIEKRFATK